VTSPGFTDPVTWIQHSTDRRGTTLTLETAPSRVGGVRTDRTSTVDVFVPPEPGPADPDAASGRADRLPLAALLVMALTGFLLIATETMPAGLLPQIAAGMGIGQGLAGQFVSAYALGTVIAAIPAVALTRGMRRKPVSSWPSSGSLPPTSSRRCPAIWRCPSGPASWPAPSPA